MLFRLSARRRAASTAIPVPRVAGSIAIAIALSVFAAWLVMVSGIEALPRWIYRMNPMTAVCMVLTGVALCIPRSGLPTASGAVRLVLGLAVAAVGVIKLAQFATGQPAGIDLLLFPREVRSLGRSRMAPNTAIAYSLLGASLVLACFRRRWAAPASQISAALALAVAAAGLVSYLYGAMDLVEFPGPSTMALQTAVGLTFASAGALWLHPRRAITGLLNDKTFGGGTARRLLPMIVLITVGLGAIRIEMARRGVLDEVNGVALLVAAVLTTLVAVVLVLTKDLAVVSRRLAARERALERAAGKLEKARDLADSAARAKADFIANVSHEIRNPLSVILVYAGRLGKRTDLDPHARRDADLVDKAGQALLTVVNDILDFSKLEEGQVVIRPRPADPAALVAEAASLLEQQAAAKNLSLTVEAWPGLPPHVLIDPDRVRQILLNLVGNAVKFTETGSVRIVADYDTRSARLRVDVEDTGPGLTAEQRDLLFRRFSQIDAANVQRSGGAGLGLAICKGLVEAMDGEIGVDSRVGGGSIFHISLPAPAVPGEAVTAA